MDTDKRLSDWAKKMGYQGGLPKNFKPVCNASTAYIWEQIMEKVKPRQDIDIIRKNLIFQQLEPQSGVILKNPIQEIKVWKKRCNLQENVSEIEGLNLEKERKISQIKQNNKALYIEKESVLKRIKENAEKAFFYENKLEDLQKNINLAQQKINSCGKLTPVRDSEDDNNNNVEEILNEASNKLEQLIKTTNTFAETNLLSNLSINVSFNDRNAVTPRRKFAKIGLMNSSRKKTKLNESLGLITNETMNESNSDQFITDLKDPKVLNQIENLLHNNNRANIWNKLKKTENELKFCLNSFFFENIGAYENRLKHNLTKLHALHIKNELTMAQFYLKTNILRQQVEDREKLVQQTLSSENDDKKKVILAIMEVHKLEAGLISSNAILNSELENLKEGLGKNSVYIDLRKEEQKSMELQKTYVNLHTKIMFKINLFAKINQTIQTLRDDNFNLVRKLNRFTDDFNWILVLNESLNASELEKFDQICLDYLRKDISTNSLPYDDKMDPNLIAKLAAFLETPYCLPEVALLGIVRIKEKLNKLKTQSCVNVPEKVMKFTFEELQSQESYISYAIDKLICMIRNHNNINNYKSAGLMKIKETMQIWVEMPFKDYISSKRLFNSQNYQYYEQMFDKYYNQL